MVFERIRTKKRTIRKNKGVEIMKILVLNGSPRPKGNTAAMTAVFRKEAENNGHRVKEFSVRKMNIKG